MGFEQAAGEVPNRLQELSMLKRLEDDWIQQPFYRYYMNEDLRKPKMAYADKYNRLRSEFFVNFGLFGLLFSPIFFLTRRFFLFRNPGLPTYLVPDNFNRVRSAAFIRQKYHRIVSLGLWLTLTMVTTQLSINQYSYYGDQGFRYISKPHKML